MVLLHHPVQNRVRYRRVSNPRMPMLNRQLTRDDRRLVGRTVINDLIWMPPGDQAEFAICCEEVGCKLISGLVRGFTQLPRFSQLAPMHIRWQAPHLLERTLYVRALIQV